ncbi:hypothetical protein TSAR_011166 [Trichomalopsis sarcophagae]|uniref:Uncharacterized protein n=1 Tax=Trichomalopsis sarcophagae TaxID=543379 RepID=A0A232EPW3_9HYME|nr:hypothetical protein TSAR_011166 [Trichomalopsis sarcophagae]
MAKKILDKAIEQLERAQRAVSTARENYRQAVEHYRLSDSKMPSTISVVAAERGINEQVPELQEKQVKTDVETIPLKTGVSITTKSSVKGTRDTCMQRTESAEAVTRFDLSMHTQEEERGHQPSPAAHTSIGKYVEVEVSRECDSQPTLPSPPNSHAQKLEPTRCEGEHLKKRSKIETEEEKEKRREKDRIRKREQGTKLKEEALVSIARVPLNRLEVTTQHSAIPQPPLFTSCVGCKDDCWHKGTEHQGSIWLLCVVCYTSVRFVN